MSELAQTAATYDKDGIDIYFLNHHKYGTNIKVRNGLCTTPDSTNLVSLKDAKTVRRLFRHVQPHGLTPIANKLDILVGDYLDKLEDATLWKKNGDSSALKQLKPVNFIIITDGAPSEFSVCLWSD